MECIRRIAVCVLLCSVFVMPAVLFARNMFEAKIFEVYRSKPKNGGLRNVDSGSLVDNSGVEKNSSVHNDDSSTWEENGGVEKSGGLQNGSVQLVQASFGSSQRCNATRGRNGGITWIPEASRILREQLSWQQRPAHIPNIFMPAQARAASIANSLRVFVYRIDSNMYPKGRIHVHASYQQAFITLLEKSKHRVFNPESADFFFVPAPLILVKQNIAHYALRLQRVLRQVGPYWDQQQDQHILMWPECPRIDWTTATGQTKPHPILLKALILCQRFEDNVDERRSLRTNYYVPPDLYADNLQALYPEPRDILAMYAGTIPRSSDPKWWAQIRAYIWKGLCRCSDCAVLGTSSNDKRNQFDVGAFFNALRGILLRSVFQIVPPGDHIDRISRDQSIAMGVVPVWWGYYAGIRQRLPWAHILNWSAFSVNFTTVQVDKEIWPQLVNLLRQLVNSGEAARLLAGVAAVQERFKWNEDGVIRTLMESLALRKLSFTF